MQEVNDVGPVFRTPAVEPFLESRNTLQHAPVVRRAQAAVSITPQNSLTGGEVLPSVLGQNGQQGSDHVSIAAIGDRLLYLGHHPHDNVVLSHTHWIGRLRDLL